MQRPSKPHKILIGPRVRKSPFFDATIRNGADAFTIYNHTYMPTSYGDNVQEYWSLVKDVTLWDVSCQRQVQITGPDARRLVEFLSPRDMRGCSVGMCKYILMTDENGGIVNDAVLLHVEENKYWISPGDGDVIWWVKGVAVNSGFDVTVEEPDVSPLQLQGPKAPHVAYALFGDEALDLTYYRLMQTELDGIPLVISRTGWSGEHCFELYLCDSQYGDQLWERVMQAGKPYNIAPIAPNTMRSVEGGLLSYCSDITVEDNPWSVGMGRFVHFDKPGDFIGRAALLKIKEEGHKTQLVGVEIDGAPIPGNDAPWALAHDGNAVGHITRCAWSPRLEKNIGWAKVPVAMSEIGAAFNLLAPGDTRAATVCEAPWFKPFTIIPEELKAEIRGE